jgi:hypothetical protein
MEWGNIRLLHQECEFSKSRQPLVVDQLRHRVDVLDMEFYLVDQAVDGERMIIE